MSPNVQESKKNPENKTKRVFILGDNIVKHINGDDISRKIEIVGFTLKVSLAQNRMHERLCSTNNKRKPKSHIDSRWY